MLSGVQQPGGALNSPSADTVVMEVLLLASITYDIQSNKGSFLKCDHFNLNSKWTLLKMTSYWLLTNELWQRYAQLSTTSNDAYV